MRIVFLISDITVAIHESCAMLESATLNQRADCQLGEFIVRVLLLFCLIIGIVVSIDSRLRRRW